MALVVNMDRDLSLVHRLPPTARFSNVSLVVGGAVAPVFMNDSGVFLSLPSRLGGRITCRVTNQDLAERIQMLCLQALDGAGVEVAPLPAARPAPAAPYSDSFRITDPDTGQEILVPREEIFVEVKEDEAEPGEVAERGRDADVSVKPPIGSAPA